jgi:hypothetical protein
MLIIRKSCAHSEQSPDIAKAVGVNKGSVHAIPNEPFASASYSS